MLDPISPPVARRPEETVELVAAALSDGDLEAVLAQYERGAILLPWLVGAGSSGSSLRDTIADLMALRLPLSATVQAVLASGDLALVLGSGRSRAPARPASGYGSAGWVRAWSGGSQTAPGASSPRPGASASAARGPVPPTSPATDLPRPGAGHEGRHRAAAGTGSRCQQTERTASASSSSPW